MSNIRITDALQALRPNSEYSVIGNVYSGIDWLDKSQTKPTEDEINAKITQLESAEPMRLLRVERNKLIAETDWRASSDLILSDAWKTYRQQLRDLPASSNPKLDSEGFLDMTSVTWPTKPS